MMAVPNGYGRTAMIVTIRGDDDHSDGGDNYVWW